MTGTLIAPVIPSTNRRYRRGGSSTAGDDPRHPLPVRDLTTARVRSAVYGLASLDCNGRIADNNLLRALAGTRRPGWTSVSRAACC